MQRWHLGFGLSLSAIAAALLVPSLPLGSRVDDPGRDEPPPPAQDASGGVLLRATLDRDAVQQGGDDVRYLVIEVSSDVRADEVRRPVDLAVVMDLSGSMIEQGRIEAAREAAGGLIDRLGAEDRFSLVTFSDQASIRVPLGVARAPELLHQVVDRLQPEGGTNLGEGLREGISQLERANAGSARRVVLLSDGIANIGVTDDAALVQLAARGRSAGVTVSAIGLGLEFNEDLLANLSEAAGGRYHFVHEPSLLEELLTDEWSAAAQSVAHELSVDLELAEGAELLQVFGWSTRLTRDSARVYLGELRAGEHRKIVARVRVPDDHAGEVAVASVGLSGALAQGERALQLRAPVTATVTEDPNRVEASIDPAAATQAARAVVGDLLDRSARLLEKGESKQAAAALDEEPAVLDAWGGSAPDVAEAVRELKAQKAALEAAPAAAPATDYHVKRAKERARDLSQ